MQALSNADRASYALDYVKREFAFAGLNDVKTTVKLVDGSNETIDVIYELNCAIEKMHVYETREKFEKEIMRTDMKENLDHD